VFLLKDAFLAVGTGGRPRSSASRRSIYCRSVSVRGVFKSRQYRSIFARRVHRLLLFVSAVINGTPSEFRTYGALDKERRTAYCDHDQIVDQFFQDTIS
jgi:hypothetical protein